ncbi:hypothetical protein G4228_010534 [Cervus hanglu yarkandensis]|nr:hypothetical protein G4228_010534 [Cervus hanglu yarkandensis]
MEGSGSLSVPCGAGDQESSAGQAGSKPTSASRDVHAGVIFSSSAILDLSQSGLHHFEEIFKVPNLRQLHLQRNALCTIPKDFFQLLPNLLWLDLRFNRITALPSGIGRHKHLKTLLLERNPIRMLPVELVKKMTVRDLPQPMLDLSEECMTNKETIGSQEPKGSMVTEKADSFPPVETLDLLRPGRSTETPENWPSEEEIRRFWKLRQEIVENEQAGALGNQLLPVELPPNLRAALSSKGKPLPHPRPLFRMKVPSFQGVLPELDSAQQALVRASQLGESRGLALRELRERQAQEQSRRDKPELQKWRERAQRRRRPEEPGGLPGPRLRRDPGAAKMAFATDLRENGKIPKNLPGKVKQSKEKPLQACQEMSGLRGQILAETLKPQAQQLHARRSRFRGLAPLEDVGRATRDVEMARRLHDEVLKLKLRSTLNRNHQCAALPRSLSLRPAASQNIFFNPKY